MRLGTKGFIVIATAVATACGDAPVSPSPQAIVTLAFTSPVQARIVTCPTCTEGPSIWAVAEFPITIHNASDVEHQIATVTVRVVNRTRGGEIARNTRPNVDHPYPTTRIPPRGALTVDAGIVYHPLPPPRDDIAVDITVTLQGGLSAAASGSIVVVDGS